ncbi:hypothetical protein LMG28690_06904 [Paraburkholderia caffeinilytica]|nr:hypothetical protein LMG28690_06904 [Paraburkholderia caffeinilytica]
MQPHAPGWRTRLNWTLICEARWSAANSVRNTNSSWTCEIAPSAAPISDLLNETEMRADLLGSEIMESAVMSGPARAIDILRAIRSMGVHGCGQIQRSHVSRPLSADRFATLLR